MNRLEKEGREKKRNYKNVQLTTLVFIQIGILKLGMTSYIATSGYNLMLTQNITLLLPTHSFSSH